MPLDNSPSLQELITRGDAAMHESKIVARQLHELLRLASDAKLRTEANLAEADQSLQAVRHSDFDAPPVSIICAGGCEAQFELQQFASDDFSGVTRFRSFGRSRMAAAG